MTFQFNIFNILQTKFSSAEQQFMCTPFIGNLCNYTAQLYYIFRNIACFATTMSWKCNLSVPFLKWRQWSKSPTFPLGGDSLQPCRELICITWVNSDRLPLLGESEEPRISSLPTCSSYLCAACGLFFFSTLQSCQPRVWVRCAEQHWMLTSQTSLVNIPLSRTMALPCSRQLVDSSLLFVSYSPQWALCQHCCATCCFRHPEYVQEFLGWIELPGPETTLRPHDCLSEAVFPWQFLTK